MEFRQKCSGHLPCRKKGDIVANKDYRNSLKISHISHNVFVKRVSHEWGSSGTCPPAYIKFVCLYFHILLRNDYLLNKNSSSLRHVAAPVTVLYQLSTQSHSVTTN